MIAVIQCAARKQARAGRLQLSTGKPVVFVADPKAAPADDAVVYARPDDLADDGTSWRDVLKKYNAEQRDNPLGLFQAYRLYEDRTYGRLVDHFGLQNVYILSAGWGLICASFQTPYYNITFSPSATKGNAYKRRRSGDRYLDFRMLPEQASDEIVFFGGKDYRPLFYNLTVGTKGRKIVFYNSGVRPEEAAGYELRRFETGTRTNWHYECANSFMDGGNSSRRPPSQLRLVE